MIGVCIKHGNLQNNNLAKGTLKLLFLLYTRIVGIYVNLDS